MGRHTAADGEPMHPVVAAALARRASDPSGPHRAVPPRGDGGLGWPGEPAPGGGAVGWPGDLVAARPTRPAADGAHLADDRADDDADDRADDPEPDLDRSDRRRGWRRLLGARAA